MFRDEIITPEDEEEMIRKAAVKIHDYGMNLPAILFLQSYKPLAYVGGQIGRFMIFPFLYFIGGDIREGGEKFFTIFENRDNVEKLIKLLEKKMEDKDSKKIGVDKCMEKNQVKEEPPKRKSWRRFFPF